jgi:type IV secretion system protein VirD4
MKGTLDKLNIMFSRLTSLRGGSGQLHHARFALAHELKPLMTHALDEEALLLGRTHLGGIYRVTPTPLRRELGHCQVIAPTGGGKGLLAVSQILTWPESLIIFDIKGDLYGQTAGYRQTLGPVYRFDTRGVGHTYDPLDGLTEEDDLYAVAKHLLFDPREGEGRGFTEKAIRALVLVWLAGLECNRQTGSTCRLLPFTRQIADMGINQAGEVIHRISPGIAKRLLDGDYNPEVDYNERKYLANSFESGIARLYPVLTQNVCRCFAGSDVTASDIIAGRKPVTVYICVPEGDLEARAPVLRLTLESLFARMTRYVDETDGETTREKGCRPVLVMLDEAGTLRLPTLAQFTATARSRGISIWAAYQDGSQIEASLRDRHNARALRNNMDAKLFYRQSEYETAKMVADSLGYRSDYSHSQTLRDGEVASEGRSEQAVPVLTARDMMELDPTEIIGFFSHHKPFRAKRMDWREFPILAKRRSIPPPRVNPLPPLPEMQLPSATTAYPFSRSGERHSRYPRFPIDPDDFN